MKNKIFIQFDTDDHYFTVIDLILASWDMELSRKIVDSYSAKKLIEEITQGKLIPDVAIIDAHMGNSEEDGKKISLKLRELVPNIQIVGFSVIESEEWADFEAIKGLKDSTKRITDILSSIVGKEFKISNAKEGSKISKDNEKT